MYPPTMPLLRAKELAEIIDKAQPSLSLCEAKLAAELQAVPGAPPLIQFNADQDKDSLAKRAEHKNGSTVTC